MRKLAGVLLIISSFFVGLYVGVWVLLIGGIEDGIDGIKETPTDGSQIVWGIVKVFASLPVGVLSFAVLLVIGINLVRGKKWSERPRLRQRAKYRTGF